MPNKEKVIIIGAGHSGGIVSILLRKEGLSLTPIYFKWKEDALN